MTKTKLKQFKIQIFFLRNLENFQKIIFKTTHKVIGTH